jgi:hypothetical protein
MSISTPMTAPAIGGAQKVPNDSTAFEGPD